MGDPAILKEGEPFAASGGEPVLKKPKKATLNHTAAFASVEDVLGVRFVLVFLFLCSSC